MSARRLADEIRAAASGTAKRCTSAIGDEEGRCQRPLGHVGCHYREDENVCRWVDKGETRMKAIYPRGVS